MLVRSPLFVLQFKMCLRSFHRVVEGFHCFSGIVDCVDCGGSGERLTCRIFLQHFEIGQKIHLHLQGLFIPYTFSRRRGNDGQGRKRRSGGETAARGGTKTQGRKQLQIKCPLVQQTPARRSGEEKTVRGGSGGQGRNKTQGRKQRLRSCPLVQQTPALHCDRCPFLWNGEHVLVLLAVD